LDGPEGAGVASTHEATKFAREELVMNEPHAHVPLAQFAAAEFTGPAVVTLEDTDVVVLDYVTSDTVAVWHDGAIADHPASTPVISIADPDQRQIALRRALLNLNHQREQALADRAAEVTRHTATLQQIRDYAIRQHRRGIICLSGLNTFLSHFGFALYEPRLTLRFAITGTYEVASDDLVAARELAATSLGVRADGICGLERASILYDVEIQDVGMVDGGEGPRLRVAYEIRGMGLVDSVDPVHTRLDAENVLASDLARIPGLVTDSAEYRLDVKVELTW
jgi:hypothetical protein